MEQLLRALERALESPRKVIVNTGVFFAALVAVFAASVPSSALLDSGVRRTAVAAGLLVIAWIAGMALAMVATSRQTRSLNGGRRPPRIGTADPYELGIHRSELAERSCTKRNPRPFYIERTQPDAELKNAIDLRRNLIVVTGPPASGKSRTAFEVMASQRSRHRLLAPLLDDGGDTSAVNRLLELRFPLGNRRRRYVLWLDNLGWLLNGHHLNASKLARWLEDHPRSLAIGTMQGDDFRRHRESDTAAALVLGSVEQVILRAELDEPEQRDAESAYRVPEEHLRNLPEYLMAATERVMLWRLAWAQNELGAMLVAMAAQWHRAGLGGGAPRAFLLAAAERCGGRTDVDDATLDAHFAWATAKQPFAFRLLEPLPDGTYRGSRLIGRELSIEQLRRLPAPVIAALRDHLADDLGRLMTVAYALVSHGQRDEARELAEHIARVATDPQHQGDAIALITELDEARDREENPAVVQQLRRAREQGVGHEPGTASVPPTPAQQGTSAAAQGDGWQSAVFEPRPPDARPRWLNVYKRVLLRRVLLVTGLVTLDVLSVAAGIGLTLLAKAYVLGEPLAEVPATLGRLLVLAAPVTPLAAWWAGLYRPDATRARVHLIVAALSGAALTGLVYVTQFSGFSVNSGAAVWGSLIVAIPICWGMRATYDWISSAFVRRGRLEARVLLIGPRDEVQASGAGLRQSMKRPMVFVGYLADERVSDDPSCLGDYDALERVVRSHYIQRCIIVEGSMPTELKAELADRCHGEDVAIETLVGLNDVLLGVGGQPDEEFALLEIAPLTLRAGAQLAKRAFDRAAVLLLLPVAVPVLLLAMLLVKLDAPHERVFVRPWRPGRGGRSFRMLRLRTAKGMQAAGGGDEWGEVGEVGYLGPPPGRLGRLLIAFGVDELPQLWNVWRGDMSMVGPRPLPLGEYKSLPTDAKRPYAVGRPGITGPWQLSRRRALGTGRLELDLLYFRNWSLFHDLAILLRTVPTVLRNGPEAIARARAAAR